MAGLRNVLLAGVLAAALVAVSARHVRIVDGTPSDIANSPWLAQIVFMMSPKAVNERASCSGAIIDATHVLTAAHCFNPELVGPYVAQDPKQLLKVLVGSTTKLKGGETIAAKSLNMHPKFHGPTGMNQKYDLAIITLAQPMSFNNNVKPIKFATKKVADNGKVFTAGWGINKATPQGMPVPSFAPGLMSSELTVIPAADCQMMKMFSNLSQDAKGSLVCTKNIRGGACAGDSGTALWNPSNELVGILHGGAACSEKTGAPLWVDVQDAELKAWMQQNGLNM